VADPSYGVSIDRATVGMVGNCVAFGRGDEIAFFPEIVARNYRRASRRIRALMNAVERIQRLPYGLKGFRAFCRLLVLEDGSTFRLARFQGWLLGFYFAGVVELIIIMPKKNGKTTLVAALALYHLLMTAAAECVIGASSEKQAAILYNQAANLVFQSGLDRRRKAGAGKYAEYEGIFDVSRGTWVIRYGLGRIRVLPADVRTAQGVIPTLAIVDEYQHHPTSGLYAIFRDGLTPRHGQMITITNPGVDFDSPLGRIRERAIQHPCDKQGRRRLYTSPDRSVVLVEWGLEDEDDTDDLTLVKMANPAPWQTVAELRRRRDSWSVKVSPGEWVRYACGRWGVGDDAPIDATTWDRGKVDIGRIEPGERVVLVPSVGHNAAIAIVASRPEGRVACKVEVIDAEEDRSIYVRTEDRILELCRSYDAEIHAPGVGFIRSRELLADKRLEVVEAPQSIAALAAATGSFNRMLRAGLLMHDGDPVLRAHALSATMKTNESGERYEVTDRSRGLVALVMAVHGVTEMGKATPKIHVYKGA